MVWVKKFILFVLLVLVLGPELAFSELYLGPGASGEFVFTVVNSSDSVGSLSTPQVVYDNKPTWFNMNSRAVACDLLIQGASCQFLVDFDIADNAPSGTQDLLFKVLFSAPNVYPPVWYPAKGHKLVIDATSPIISINQPEWRNSPATTTIVTSEIQSTVIRGPQATFTAYDGESGIDDFKIINSSGENIAAGSTGQSFNTASFSASFTEDAYMVSALNKAGASTSGQLYVDYTPTVVIDSFASHEDVTGVYSDDFSLSAFSRWGLVYVKLLPNTSAYNEVVLRFRV